LVQDTDPVLAVLAQMMQKSMSDNPPPADDPADRKAISGALTASGFPFQLAVRDVFQRSDWVIVEEEFPWRDPLGKDEFLDIVSAPSSSNRKVIATVECKKTTKEVYSFLLPPRNQRDVETFSGLGCRAIQDSSPRLVLEVGVWKLLPYGVDAAFCVTSDSSKASERLLEKEAQKLIRATDAFASALRQGKTKAGSVLVECLFVPIIVTNANLYVVPFDPLRDVSLAKGTFEGAPPNADPISYVRFRKAFVSGAKGQPSERSVFVVNVEFLQRFLNAVGSSLERPSPNEVWRLEG
jgi:hypothetical protein